MIRLIAVAVMALVSLAASEPDAPARISVPGLTSFGNRGADLATAITADAESVVVASRFDGRLRIGELPAIAALGGGDIALTAFDTRLRPRWSARLGGANHDELRALLWSADTLIAAGFFVLSMDVGLDAPLVSVGASDAFVARFARTGATESAHGIGGKQSDLARVLASSQEGLMVGGNFQAAGRFAPGKAGVWFSAGGSDIFVQAFDQRGELRWARQLGGPGEDSLLGLETAPDGRSVLMLSHEQTIDLAAGDERWTLAASDGPSSALIWLSNQGIVKAAIPLDAEGNQHFSALALRSDGSMVIAGEFQGDVEWRFGGQRVRARAKGSSDVMVIWLDATGGLLGHRQFGNAVADTVDALESSGMQSWLALGVEGNFEIDGQRILQGSDVNALLLALGGPRDAALSVGFTGQGVQKITALSADPAGVWIAGVFGHALRVDGHAALQAVGKSDVFVARAERRLSGFAEKRTHEAFETVSAGLEVLP